MRTVPSSGKEIVPASETRVSSVMSGFWKTVMRMASPEPRRYSAVAPDDRPTGAGWALVGAAARGAPPVCARALTDISSAIAPVARGFRKFRVFIVFI